MAWDLKTRRITSARRLGIESGSNGGLLLGNMLVRHRELMGAVVCQVPSGDWAFLKDLSPYHNVHAGAAYPPVLFITNTRDDREHPAHARMMMARMRALGCDVHYFENIEGGRGAGADNRQTAHR